jgi:hypothetical protein
MAAIVFNIAKGRVAELYKRVKDNDPANSAFIVVPLELSGLEADDVLIDKDTLSDVLSGTTNEQTANMGRKTLTDADLAAFPSPDDTNDRIQLSLPAITWAGATGNAVGAILVCYDPDTTGGTDANIVPLVKWDVSLTPDGSNASLASAVFYQSNNVPL